MTVLWVGKTMGTDDRGGVPGRMELLGFGSLEKVPHDSAWHVEVPLLSGQEHW